MKRIIIVLLITLLSSVLLFSEDAYLSQYYSPELMAQGGVTSTAATGLDALFSNPAGIVRENELRLMDVTGGPYVNFSRVTIPLMRDVLTGGGSNETPDYEYDQDTTVEQAYDDGYWDGREANTGFLGFINPDMIVPVLKAADYRNGVGGHVGMSGGAAYYGIGVGGVFTSDMLFEKTSLNSNVDFTYVSELVISAGLSHNLDLGFSDLFVGASVNKIWQTFSTKTITEEEVEQYVNGTLDMGDTPAVLGEGLGFNAGAILKSGPLMISLHVNNILSTALTTKTGTLSDALSVGMLDQSTANDEMSDFFIPKMAGVATETHYKIPMSMTVGVGFQKDFGKILGVQAAADYRHVFSDNPDETIWKNVHIGGAVDILDEALSVRAGLDQGYLTAGAGVKFVKFFNLLEVEFNGTYYARELGSYAGHRQGEAMLFDVVFTL
jgi:hypothetical protein